MAEPMEDKEKGNPEEQQQVPEEQKAPEEPQAPEEQKTPEREKEAVEGEKAEEVKEEKKEEEKAEDVKAGEEKAEEKTAEKPAPERKTKPEPETKEETGVEEKKEEKPKKKTKGKGKKEEEKEKAEKKWYVVQTYSGQEDKVKDSIERNVASMNMGHKIFQILVPTEETVELKNGKRIEKVRKMFPGYVFIEMLLDDESWYVIRGTPGVAKFIGTKVTPTPVSDREMQRVLKQLGVKEEKLEVTFEKGEAVRIISGPFRGYTGSIDEVNAQRGKLKTLISIFGRDTPVEVNFEQVQRIV